MNAYNFTARLHNVLQMAREEAVRLHHEYVGTEHLLLGLLREDGGVAAAVLANLVVKSEEIKQKIEETVKEGKAASADGPELPYTSRSKKVLELAMMEARELNHSHVGTEHLLLGLLREKKGIAAQVLVHSGVTLDRVTAALATVVHIDDADQPRGARIGNACGWFPMEHEEIVAWVKAHEEVMSADLATIAKYPMPFRKVIVKMVTEERHLALWQEHLAVASAADTTLTEEQRSFVAETAASLPVIFGSAAAMSDWKARVAGRFTGEQHFALFGSLGPPEPPGGLPLPADAKPTAAA